MWFAFQRFSKPGAKCWKVGTKPNNATHALLDDQQMQQIPRPSCQMETRMARRLLRHQRKPVQQANSVKITVSDTVFSLPRCYTGSRQRCLLVSKTGPLGAGICEPKESAEDDGRWVPEHCAQAVNHIAAPPAQHARGLSTPALRRAARR